MNTFSPARGQSDGLYGAARIKAMFAVCLAILLAQVDYAIANVALPDIGADLHSAPSDTVWVVNAYQLASLSALLPLAAAGAWIGYARMCVIGIVLFMVASVGCAMAPSLPILTLARAAQGFGAASMLGVVSALIRFIYPEDELGKGIAINTLIVGLGMALGPTIAGLILAIAHWPWLFWINLPIGALTLALALTSLPKTPRAGEMPDPAGALLCIIALTAIGLGGNSVAHANGLWLAVAMLLLGMTALQGLIRKERDRPQPIMPVDLLRGGEFRVAFLVGVIGYISSNFFMISAPFTLHDHYGWNATETGLLMTPWAFGLIISASVTRRIADRMPAGILSSIGLLGTMAGFLALRFLPVHPTAFDVVWRIGLAGFGFGVFQVPNNRAMLLSAPLGREGGASGMVQVSRQSGQTLGGIGTALLLRLLPEAGTAVCLDAAAFCAGAAALWSASRLLDKKG
ncbi:MFS transporter [Acetobacter conturbans]|uniref:MFS transporter n=1 Tax=Acetobacter conturbans TaxID=1737472 RepID=A0ABX0K1N1_9PROT|nr:MFS transporter [Acetobacter conturbans]NHN88603.1 MFS transporter [Acetobacter conturbans]